MRLIKTVSIVVILLLATMLIASCGGGDEKTEETEKVTVKVGLTAPLSGVAAGYGQDIKLGIDMAIDDVNKGGGLVVGDTTYEFKLVTADDGMVPEQALTNAQGFLLKDKINIIWDPTANTVMPLMGINETPGEEFLLMAFTSTPLYAPPVVDTPNSLMITLPPPFMTYIPDFIQAAAENGWSKMAMMQTSGIYGEVWGQAMKPAWESAGLAVVSEVPANYYTETDFTPFLTTALAAAPDVIFAGGPSEPTALLIDQARGMGYEGGFIIIDQAKLDEIGEIIGMGKLEGTIGVLPISGVVSQWPAMGTFIKDFEDEYDWKATWEAAICYTSFHVLTEAMVNAGSVDDVRAIRKAFAESATTDTSVLPVGVFGLDDTTGAMLIPATTTVVKDGNFIDHEFHYWWEQQ